jgi:hypothetical protein
MITTDSHETKNIIEHEEGWTKVIAGKTKVKGRWFRVMVHAVRTNKIETASQEKALAELQDQNPQLKDKVKFLKLAWKQKTLKAGKLHGPLLIDVGTLEEANALVLEGLLHDHEIKNCELFHSECITTQYFKCYRYDHISVTCRRSQTCRDCAKKHPSAACQTAKDPRTYFCSNCKGKHQACDRACAVRKAEAERAAAAYATRPTLYKVTSNASRAAQSPPIHFHFTPHPTPVAANQGQQIHQP